MTEEDKITQKPAKHLSEYIDKLLVFVPTTYPSVDGIWRHIWYDREFADELIMSYFN